MKIAGEVRGFRVDNGFVVLETAEGEFSVRGELVGVRRVSPGGARALVSLILSAIIIASMLITARPEGSWPFVILIAYVGILTAAGIGAYMSAYLLLPRRAVILRTEEGYVAYLLNAGKKLNGGPDSRLAP